MKTSTKAPTLDEQIASDIGLLRVEAAKYSHDDYRREQLNGIANTLKSYRDIEQARGRRWGEKSA